METNMQDQANLENKGFEDTELPAFNFSKTQKKMLKAYKAASCSISEACRLCGMSRMWFHHQLNNCPEFKEACKMMDEEDLDFAEGQLRLLMSGQYVYRLKKDKNGNTRAGRYELDAQGQPIRDYINPIDNSAVIFKLKTKGKDRGYTYRQEITGANGSAIGGFEINIVRKKKA